VELAFVVGQRGSRIEKSDAWQYVAGYGVFIDLSARDIQHAEKQWFRGKSFDGGGPFGPFLLTADEMSDPHDLAIELDVNGETRQSSNTGQVTFRIDYLIHHISQTMTLEPGDIVATGTPSGVGAFRDPPVFLQPGDHIRARVESLGELHCSIGPTR
jgi:2-keto-4-pentenoate hydratase/2-oxohepta-3-ene-1,7-dioic acid hydratase in catechol pathway